MWKIECTCDADCYSIRSKTKKGAIALYNEHRRPSGFSDVVTKMVYEFEDSFDLADSLMSEDRGDLNLIEEREYRLK